ncbi:MAG TPA: DUF2752 domain-containing protein [Acidimicrobiales bacterium]|nr:DUF2752 domain-containing protein [Acidimicrobiales bacterium]
MTASSRSLTLDLHDIRVAGGVMLGAAAVRAAWPGHAPGLPCPLRTLTGVPCPLCGMTTSVTATVRGHLGSAVAANPAGLLFVAASVALLVSPRLKAVDVPRWLPYVALTLMWMWELLRFGIL